VASTCPRCQAELPRGAKFCVECGEPIDSASRPRSPESYTPKYLAEKILTFKPSLLGERKQVTVLFADLKGSMEQLADRDSEDALKVLDPVLELMMEAVHRYEGTVNQVMGDGIMALFGAPVALEDHAIRGCYAALWMQESIRKYSEGIQRGGGGPVHIRVGLNSGEVVVRSIGSDLRMDYTAVGPTTHLAARMEQIAVPGSILITGATLALVEGYVQVREMGAQRVKGLGYPVEVYELLASTAVLSRFHVAASRGLTRFVGRSEELRQLGQSADQARAGHGQIVAVLGEPGVGKSRLVWEFLHSPQTEGFLVLEGGSVSYGQATSYLPAIGLLKAYFQIEAHDDARKMREKVTGKLHSMERSPELSVLPLLWLLDVPTDDMEWQRLDPAQRRRRTVETLKSLFLGESRIQPLLLIFEDLHWIDPETQAVLDGLVESLPTARVLLLVNFRREYQHGWGGKSYYRQIRVDPLPLHDASELLDSLLGQGVELSPLKAMLIQRTERNPFFIEESVRTLVETGTLTGRRGAFALAKTPERIEIPATVQALIAARIDRLEPTDKQLLQAASVIGTEVPFSLLREIADESESVLLERIACLRAGEFLYESRLFPDLGYSFKHAVTQEVAYGGLLHDRRRKLHARIFTAMESLYRDRLTEQVERLAHHAEEGELWERAAHYLHQAGLQAFARSGNRQAAVLLEKAIVSLARLPASREVDEQAIDVRFDLRNALTPLGAGSRVLDHLREAQLLAERLGDRRRQGRALSFMTNGLFFVGDYRAAIEVGQRAWTIAEELDDFALKTATRMYVGRAHESLGGYREAVAIYTRTVASLSSKSMHDRLGLPVLPAVFARSLLVTSLAELGEFAQAGPYADEATRVAEASKQPDNLFWAYRAAALIRLGLGLPGDAAEILDRALAVCRASDLTTYVAAVSSDLGLAYALTGRLDEGLRLLEYGAAQTGARRQWYHPQAVLQLGEGYLAAGRDSEARDSGDRALQLARERRERGREAYALRLLADLTSRQGSADRDRALKLYRGALALAEELGMRPCAARCRLESGELLRQVDDRTGARASLTSAAEAMESMGMRSWALRARRALEAVV
jgi:class 3 adenylate cyclase/tetratricopeptide (TPR) repeat protein